MSRHLLSAYLQYHFSQLFSHVRDFLPPIVHFVFSDSTTLTKCLTH